MSGRKGRLPNERKQLLNGTARREYGCLTTWEDVTGALPPMTIQRARAPLAACMRAAAAIALGMSESYRLVAYSTPESIYGDLIGVRADALQAPSGFKATYSKSMPKPLPEVMALAMAKLPRALLHPRLERPTAKRAYRASA